MATEKTTTAARLLREAADKIEAAVGYLNTERHTCESCGSGKFASYDEGRVAGRIEKTPMMLRQNADRLVGVKGGHDDADDR